MSPTPILDLEQELPKTRRAWASAAIAGSISIAILLAPILAKEFLPGAPTFNALLWLPAIYIGIAIHEIGHLFLGKLVGMDPGGLSVGGFLLLKSGRNWVVRFDMSQCFIGGFAKPLPAKNDFRLSRFAWMIAGGPLATLVFTGLSLVAVFKFGGGTWSWIGTLFWGATLPLSSLIPYSSGA